jgi:hypothetical protein
LFVFRTSALQNEIFDQRDYDVFSLPAVKIKAQAVIGEVRAKTGCVGVTAALSDLAIKDDETDSLSKIKLTNIITYR